MIRHRIHRLPAAALGLFLISFLALPAGFARATEPEGMLSKKDVKALVAGAKTAEDHLKLARHFHAAALKHDAEAAEHEALAIEYARHPRLGAAKIHMAPNSAEHCKFYAAHCRKAAREMRAMAAAHETMAKQTVK